MDIQREFEQLKQENQALREALKAAEQRIQELTSMLGQNSRNSHWPSSRDKGRKKKRTKSLRGKSEKKRGGQQGHPGHALEFSQKPDEIEVHRPSRCQHCQAEFGESEVAVGVEKRQVHDLPPLRLVVSEHQGERMLCRQCGQMSQGAFPSDVKSPVQYGPQVQQLAVYLKIEQFIPYDRSRQFFADLFGLNLSPGTLQNIIRRASRALQPVVGRIKEGLIASDVVHFDESGLYIGGQRHWLHTAGTQAFTSYYPHARRGRLATDDMGVLPHFQGVAVHDFWSAYRQYKQCQHSLCNVHHLRELTAVVEEEDQRWAAHFKLLLLSAKQGVEEAHRTGLAELPRSKVNQIERLYAQLIETGLHANPPPPGGWPKGKRGRVKKTKARNLVERLDKHRAEVLAFVYDFKVPFDNNLAERDIRMIKVQQKISGCFRSQTGAEDFCTIRSYISTMRKQHISVWMALASVFSGSVLLPDLTPV
jgi:transposase